MSLALSLIGLILAAAGTFVLLVHDIRERSGRFKAAIERARMKHELGSQERSLRNVQQALVPVLHAGGEDAYATAVTQGIKPILESIEKSKAELGKLDDIDEAVLRSMLPLAHPIGFLLLLLGFVAQAMALLAAPPASA